MSKSGKKHVSPREWFDEMGIEIPKRPRSGKSGKVRPRKPCPERDTPQPKRREDDLLKLLKDKLFRKLAVCPKCKCIFSVSAEE